MMKTAAGLKRDRMHEEASFLVSSHRFATHSLL